MNWRCRIGRHEYQRFNYTHIACSVDNREYGSHGVRRCVKCRPPVALRGQRCACLLTPRPPHPALVKAIEALGGGSAA